MLDVAGGVRPYAVYGALSDEELNTSCARFVVAGLASALSPYSLRHSFITLALRGGAGLPMVQAAAPRQPTDDHIRLRADHIRDTVMEICCGLHNLRLKHTPWKLTT